MGINLWRTDGWHGTMALGCSKDVRVVETLTFISTAWDSRHYRITVTAVHICLGALAVGG